jgi:PAS domain S-box-containing protein
MQSITIAEAACCAGWEAFMSSSFQQSSSTDRPGQTSFKPTSWRKSLLWDRLHDFSPLFQFSGYWLAVVSVFLAFLLRLVIDPWLGDQMPYLTFVVAIAATGLYAGVRPAILATLLGAVTAYFCFVPPRYEWGFAGISDAVGFGVYLFAAAGVVLVTLARNSAAARAEESLKQQIETERKLLDAQSLLKKFLDNGPACAYLRDEEGRYVYLNEMAKRLLGIDGADASGISVESLPAQTDLHFRGEDCEILQTGRPHQSVDKLVRPDGDHYWLTVKFPFIDQNGKTFVGGTSFEITERVQAEEVLRKTERIASSGQMASLLSHHVNNPLAAVTNCLYLLSGETLTPTGEQYLSRAKEELERLNRITGLTLGFYHENENPVPISICPVIEEVTQALSAVPAFQHVHVDRDFKCDATVLASRRGIQQLLTSLLANAMESGATTIRIRVRHGSDWRRPGVSGIRISIADDGHGISRENSKQLFQPFFSTKGTRGTGLGLWSSRVIVRKIDGTIKLRSVSTGPKTGTSVSLFLPTVAIVANSLNSFRKEPSQHWSAGQMNIGHSQEPFG